MGSGNGAIPTGSNDDIPSVLLPSRGRHVAVTAVVNIQSLSPRKDGLWRGDRQRPKRSWVPYTRRSNAKIPATDPETGHVRYRLVHD